MNSGLYSGPIIMVRIEKRYVELNLRNFMKDLNKPWLIKEDLYIIGYEIYGREAQELLRRS